MPQLYIYYITAIDYYAIRLPRHYAAITLRHYADVAIATRPLIDALRHYCHYGVGLYSSSRYSHIGYAIRRHYAMSHAAERYTPRYAGRLAKRHYVSAIR